MGSGLDGLLPKEIFAVIAEHPDSLASLPGKAGQKTEQRGAVLRMGPVAAGCPTVALL
jgi:hypothetical protein